MKLALWTLTIMTLAACAPAHEGVPGTENALDDGEPITFSAVKTTLIEPHCIGCHNPSSPRIDLSTREALLRVPGLVVAGDPAASRIVAAIESGRMPPGGNLPAAKLQLLKDWITDGAL